MSTFQGGVIPVVNVPSDKFLTTLGTLAKGAIGIAIGPELGALVSGINPSNPTLQQVTQGGQQYLTGLMNRGLNVNTEALGPYGSLVTEVARDAVRSAGTNLLKSVFERPVQLPEAVDAPTPGESKRSSSRAFPGAGDEPDADYGGSSYSLGRGGKDVVFTIRPAVTGAKTQIGTETLAGSTSSLSALSTNMNGAFSGQNTFKDLMKGSFSGGNNIFDPSKISAINGIGSTNAFMSLGGAAFSETFGGK